MTKKIKRYHKDIFFPEWAEDSLREFLSKLSEAGYITFSSHALKRTVEHVVEHGMGFLRFLLKSVRKDTLRIEDVFEFYSVEHKIKKVCFRCSSEYSLVDLVLVISQDSTAITVFTINKGDLHGTLDKTLYEKE